MFCLIKIILIYFDLFVWIFEFCLLIFDDELDVIIILIIVYKVKGLEWDFVCLYDDFNVDLLFFDIDLGKCDDELNLIYVVVI